MVQEPASVVEASAPMLEKSTPAVQESVPILQHVGWVDEGNPAVVTCDGSALG